MSFKKTARSGLRNKLLCDLKKKNPPNWCRREQKNVCQDLCKTVLANKDKFWIRFSPEEINKKHSISETHSFEVFSIYLIFSAIYKYSEIK